MFALIGMILIRVVFNFAQFAFSPFISPFASLDWIGWTAFPFAGLLVGILVWLWGMKYATEKRVDGMQRNLKANISPGEQKRFKEINTLYGSKDPAERQRFLKLVAEYREKVLDALKK